MTNDQRTGGKRDGRRNDQARLARGRGGVVEDVVASNIQLKNAGTAIVLSMRCTPMPVEPRSERTPTFRDIRIDHIAARNVRKCCTIKALEEKPIEKVVLAEFDLSGTAGVTCSYAKNVTFTNVKVTARKDLYVEEHSEDTHRVG
jgi:hypothetical protein